MVVFLEEQPSSLSIIAWERNSRNQESLVECEFIRN